MKRRSFSNSKNIAVHSDERNLENVFSPSTSSQQKDSASEVVSGIKLISTPCLPPKTNKRKSCKPKQNTVVSNEEDMKKLQEDFIKNRRDKNKLFLDSLAEKYGGNSSSDEIDWNTLKVKKSGKWSELKEEDTNPRGAILLSDKSLEYINQVRELSLKDYWGTEIEEKSQPSKAECSSLIIEDDPPTKPKVRSEKKSPYPCSSKNTPDSRPKKTFPSKLTLETITSKMKTEHPWREVTPQIKQKESENEETPLTYSENNNPMETKQPKVILKKEQKKSKDESSPHSSNGESYLCSPRKRRISVEISNPAKKRILHGDISTETEMPKVILKREQKKKRSQPSKAECSSLIIEDDPPTKQEEGSEKKSPYPCSSKNTSGSRPKKNFPSNLTLETSRKMETERPSREVTRQIKQKGSGNEETPLTYSDRINLKSHHKKRISLPDSLENNNPVETEQPKGILKKEQKKSKDESSPRSSNGESYLCSPRKRRISVEISSPAKKRILPGDVSNTPIDLIFKSSTERKNIISPFIGESGCIDPVSKSRRKSVLRK